MKYSCIFAILLETIICVLFPLIDLKYCTLLPNGMTRSLSNFVKLSNAEELGLFFKKYNALNLEYTSVNLAIYDGALVARVV